MSYKTTNRWRKFWKNRKINWAESYGTGTEAIEHPHRKIIVDVIRSLNVGSVMEIGMGGGVNLIRLKRDIPHLQVGGCDINPEAVEEAIKALPQSKNILDVRDATDLFFSDKSVDCALTDMALIYLNRREVRKTLREIRRTTRRYALFIEFHHKSWWKRLALKLGVGYNSYDYGKLLEEMDFHDIVITKLPEDSWPGGEPQKTYGHVIFCRT